MPYRYWLKRHNGGMPTFREKLADWWVHRSLIFAKLPSLYLNPRLKRRTWWVDEPPGSEALPAEAGIAA